MFPPRILASVLTSLMISPASNFNGQNADNFGQQRQGGFGQDDGGFGNGGGQGMNVVGTTDNMGQTGYGNTNDFNTPGTGGNFGSQGAGGDWQTGQASGGFGGGAGAGNDQFGNAGGNNIDNNNSGNYGMGGKKPGMGERIMGERFVFAFSLVYRFV